MPIMAKFIECLLCAMHYAKPFTFPLHNNPTRQVPPLPPYFIGGETETQKTSVSF